MIGDEYCYANGDVTTGRLDDANDGSTRGHERNRRAVLAALLVSSSAGAHTDPASAESAATRDDGGIGGTPPATTAMDGLTRRIRTGVVRGARLIDKADGAWERFSDEFGLGGERNMPRRNVIDAGGNAVTRGVVRGESAMDDGRRVPIFDETFALGVLRRCDEVRTASDARVTSR